MRSGVSAQKVGMTRIFTDAGEHVPVTVLKLDGCQVVAHRTAEVNGYSALQIGIGKAKVKNVSKAERQRFAIARALATAPAIVWADEPTGALDSLTSQEIIDLMLRLNCEHGLTFVWVTHAVEVAQQARRLIEMRDGLIERDTVLAPKQAANVAQQAKNEGVQ